MAYDAALVKRIEALLRRRKGVRQQAMFGGVCFLVKGHMCCGVERNRLMVRAGPEAYEAALAKPHVRPMDFTGRPLRGFIFVLPDGLRGEQVLKSWLDLGLRYVQSQPPKRTVRFRAALKVVNRRHGKTFKALADDDLGKKVRTLLREDRKLLKRLAQ